MITLDKQTVLQWMLLDCMAKENYYQEKINIFENKYKTTFESFQKKIESSEKENFQEWDDYIDWKAYNGFLKRVKEKTYDLRNGNIQLAG